MLARRIVFTGTLVALAAVPSASQAAQLVPRPVAGAATFLCPRYLPEFGLELGAVSGEIYAQTSTEGAPGGSILYGQIRATSAAVDSACRRSRLASAGRAAGLAETFIQLPQASSYADYDGLTCFVRGAVVVRLVPILARGARVGTRMDIGVVGRRNLVARITVGKRGGTLRVSPLCR